MQSGNLRKLVDLCTNSGEDGVKVVALEGQVRAGKSTIIDKYSKDGKLGIQEYSSYVDTPKIDFPEFPPKDADEAMQNSDFFLRLESQRSKVLRDSDFTGTALVDRSIFSLIAFEHGACESTGFDISDSVIDNIIDKNQEFILPKHVIYLDIELDEAKRRAAAAGVWIADFLLTQGFNFKFKEFFVNLENEFPSFVTILNANKSAEDVYSSVLKTINSLS